MSGRPARGLLLVAGVSLAGCQALQPAERATIDAWLGCIECYEHELDSVRALAVRKHQATVNALRDDLLDGPSAGRRQNLERQLDSSYQTLRTYRGQGGVISQAEFVRRYRENLIGTYRIRSAVALARIGGPDVKPALDSAAVNKLRTPGDSLRPVDSVAVRFARDSLWTP